ncbi:hypothetical protein [Chryseobacterium lathyri]|uniref:Uncharacterized protein n=1 Tax=Chryseobacterium lathyri TaxID=395933 RepID=A0ABT9SKM0_9FLAO|nr:hypothetical protein [Chryseobacterium lathyri]MDP9959381.1 hypothetical protein [Chryseobacterium lathyri]
MKAWTLFFVILFLNIYEQHHISTWFITGNGFLQNSTKPIVKDHHNFTRSFTGAVQKIATSSINALENGAFCFQTFENNKKLTTTGTGTGISAQKINSCPLAKIKSKGNYPKETIAETTLIKANLI